MLKRLPRARAAKPAPPTTASTLPTVGGALSNGPTSSLVGRRQNSTPTYRRGTSTAQQPWRSWAVTSASSRRRSSPHGRHRLHRRRQQHPQPEEHGGCGGPRCLNQASCGVSGTITVAAALGGGTKHFPVRGPDPARRASAESSPSRSSWALKRCWHEHTKSEIQGADLGGGRRTQRPGPQAPERPVVLRLEGRGRRDPHCRRERVGAEKHVDRPGWGGGRKMGLDSPTIRHGGNGYCNWFVAKVRAQGGRASCIKCSNFGCNPPDASPWACDAAHLSAPTFCLSRAATLATHESGPRQMTTTRSKAAGEAKAKARARPAATTKAATTPRRTGATGF